MSKIELPKPVREDLVRALSKYLKDELDVEVSGFDAVFLLDFVIECGGPHLSNPGLADAQALVRAKADEIVEAVYQLEKTPKG